MFDIDLVMFDYWLIDWFLFRLNVYLSTVKQEEKNRKNRFAGKKESIYLQKAKYEDQVTFSWFSWEDSDPRTRQQSSFSSATKTNNNYKTRIESSD